MQIHDPCTAGSALSTCSTTNPAGTSSNSPGSSDNAARLTGTDPSAGPYTAFTISRCPPAGAAISSCPPSGTSFTSVSPPTRYSTRSFFGTPSAVSPNTEFAAAIDRLSSFTARATSAVTFVGSFFFPSAAGNRAAMLAAITIISDQLKPPRRQRTNRFDLIMNSVSQSIVISTISFTLTPPAAAAPCPAQARSP